MRPLRRSRIIAPISSWAAAVNSYVPKDAGITGFQLFLRTIPYNLYAILTIVMVFFVIIAGFDFGLMKKHEENAAKRRSVYQRRGRV